ncbi:hypothetical protein LguiA_030994 [Lonicera macranthoides]
MQNPKKPQTNPVQMCHWPNPPHLPSQQTSILILHPSYHLILCWTVGIDTSGETDIQKSLIRPNKVTIVASVSARADLGALSRGLWAHAYVLKNNLRLNCFVGTTLTDFAIHGQGHEALDLFRKMRIEGFAPDEVTIVGVICACSHVGLVDEGCKLSRVAQGGGGKGKTMPMEPNAILWRALLGAALELLLLSIIYVSMNKWEDAKRVRKLMKDNGVNKMPASSIVDINEPNQAGRCIMAPGACSYKTVNWKSGRASPSPAPSPASVNTPLAPSLIPLPAMSAVLTRRFLFLSFEATTKRDFETATATGGSISMSLDHSGMSKLIKKRDSYDADDRESKVLSLAPRLEWLNILPFKVYKPRLLITLGQAPAMTL